MTEQTGAAPMSDDDFLDLAKVMDERPMADVELRHKVVELCALVIQMGEEVERLREALSRIKAELSRATDGANQPEGQP